MNRAILINESSIFIQCHTRKRLFLYHLIETLFPLAIMRTERIGMNIKQPIDPAISDITILPKYGTVTMPTVEPAHSSCTDP